MPYGLRLSLMFCGQLLLWFALRRLGLSSVWAFVVSTGVFVGFSAFVQYGLGINYK